MIKTKCNTLDIEHIKECEKCISYHSKINPTSLLPINLSVIKKTQRNLNLASGIEIIYLLKSLKTFILQENKTFPSKISIFLNELQSIYIQLHINHLQNEKNIDRCIENINSHYNNTIIDDIFDAFSVIFHFLHNSAQDCLPKCPVHKALELLITEEINCQCGYKINYN